VPNNRSDAHQKITYTWRYDGYPGDSTLTYELFPEGDTTLVRMTWAGTHSFPADTFPPEGFQQGATITLDALKTFVETKETR
jgi:uncharacterized protein YndB with AHSA1/START domain